MYSKVLKTKLLFMLLVTFMCCVCVEPGEETTTSVHPLGDGHGKPFGQGRPSTHLPIVSHKIMGKEFFSKYVATQEPVVFKGLVKDSAAVSLWTDEYFLSLKNIPKDHVVLVESRKKENRTAPTTSMPFKDFVEVYNLTSQYMVEPVPEFLKGDMQIPSVLQCPELLQTALVDTLMWFSSGGTKSVVHTDSVENLNCVLAGSKKFVFVSPKYKKLVALDRPEGSYSDIDVDAVDYDKYPGLAEVEFQHAEIEAGDCLYIPYKWIHQVESFNRSIAINVWWDKSKNQKFNLDECNTEFDPSLTLSDAKPLGFDSIDSSPEVIKDQVTEAVENNPVDFEEFANAIGLSIYLEEAFEQSEFYYDASKRLKQIFDKLDVDSNGYIEESDARALTSDDWNSIAQNFEDIYKIITEYMDQDEDSDNTHDEL